MTREEIEKEYKIVDGIIQEFGKFGGLPLYIPYFYDSWQEQWNVEYDYYWPDAGGAIAYIKIDAEDKKLFPEIPADIEFIYLHERSDGFIFCPKCAREFDNNETEDSNKPQFADVNYENTSLYGEHCNERIESAYAED